MKNCARDYRCEYLFFVLPSFCIKIWLFYTCKILSVARRGGWGLGVAAQWVVLGCCAVVRANFGVLPEPARREEIGYHLRSNVRRSVGVRATTARCSGAVVNFSCVVRSFKLFRWFWPVRIFFSVFWIICVLLRKNNFACEIMT